MQGTTTLSLFTMFAVRCVGSGILQRGLTVCVCVLECNLETFTNREARPDLGCCNTEIKLWNFNF